MPVAQPVATQTETYTWGQFEQLCSFYANLERHEFEAIPSEFERWTRLLRIVGAV